VSTARFIVGDVFERLAELPDDSVDLVFTSPPATDATPSGSTWTRASWR
jgi:23S rRNA G2069 N7-methylase RlmK/C1962 C5-methylase RlmI